MKQHQFTFGDDPTYLFKDLDINEKYGYPIYVDGEHVGGILIEKRILKEKWKWAMVLGIEIMPKFRNKGFASAIINNYKNTQDVITGAITEDKNLNFWKQQGAEIYKLPESYNLMMSLMTRDNCNNGYLFHIQKKDEEILKYFEIIYKNLTKVQS